MSRGSLIREFVSHLRAQPDSTVVSGRRKTVSSEKGRSNLENGAQ